MAIFKRELEGSRRVHTSPKGSSFTKRRITSNRLHLPNYGYLLVDNDPSFLLLSVLYPENSFIDTIIGLVCVVLWAVKF